MPTQKPTEIETARFNLRALHPMVLAWKTFDWTKKKNAFEHLAMRTAVQKFTTEAAG